MFDSVYNTFHKTNFDATETNLLLGIVGGSGSSKILFPFDSAQFCADKVGCILHLQKDLQRISPLHGSCLLSLMLSAMLSEIPMRVMSPEVTLRARSGDPLEVHTRGNLCK